MDNDSPKISVIVPMYNAEKYLGLCINSILAQTFKNFELILVDDCSTDKTLEVAKTFTDSRIKIICNEKNLGMPGLVRNVGIDAAKGEYIYFCDDDDAILSKGLEYLITAAEKNSADIVNTTQWYYSITPDFQSLKNLELKLKKFSAAQAVSEDLKKRITEEFLTKRMHIAPWLSLYKRKFLLDNKIKFPDAVAEDIFFSFDAVCATSKITKIDTPFYIWRTHAESTTHNFSRIKKNLDALQILCGHIEEKLSPLEDSDFTKKVLMYWISHAAGSYILPFNKLNKTDEFLKALQPTFRENSLLIYTLLQIYFQERNNNAKMKNELININKQISSLLKV